MNKSCRLGLILIVLSLLSLAAGPAPDPDGLFRAADDAFRRGEFPAAAALYDRAGERSPDPSRAAFGAASAKLRQALAVPEGRAALLNEAAELFRCCLSTDDPRHVLAWNGLAACRIEQARDGQAVDLNEAADGLAACLREPGVEGELAADLRHNHELALLLAAQAAPPPKPESPRDPPPPGDDPQPPSPEPKRQPGDPPKNPSGTDPNRTTQDPQTPQPMPSEGPQPTTSQVGHRAGLANRPAGPNGAADLAPDPKNLKEAFERVREGKRSDPLQSGSQRVPGVKDS